MFRACDAQRSRRFGRRQRDVDLIQWPRQPIAACFEVRLFTGPTVKKCCLTPVWRKRLERCMLARRENTFGDPLGIRDAADALQIDADVSGARHCVKDQPMRVRQIELDAVRSVKNGESRFSPTPIAKLNLIR